VPNPDLGTLQGRVLDGDSGLALAGVTADLSGTATATQVTDADGLFQFAGLQAGPYTLTLRLTEYAVVMTSTVVPSGGQVNVGNLRLLKQLATATTGTIRGVVTAAATGLPLAGALVRAQGQTAFTSSAGSYQLSAVPPGPVTVTVSLAGYLSAGGSADLHAGDVLIFSPSLALDPGTPTEAALVGVVTAAASGLPLAGVTVQVSGSSTATALTDSSGAYRIAPLAVGPLTAEARLAGYDTVRVSTTVVAGAQIAFSPALYATGTTPPGQNASRLTGVVLDASTSAPLAGVTVEASHSGITVVQHTTADGRFTVSNITAAEVSLQLTLAGYRASALTLFLAPLTVADLGQVRLRPEAVAVLLPDLVVTAVDTHQTLTDPHTLAVSGTVQVTLRNQGTSAAPPGLVLLAFEDANQDGAYDPEGETALGSAVVLAGLVVGQEATVAIAVQGVLPFRDAPLSVWVDSAQTVVESQEDNTCARRLRSAVAGLWPRGAP